MRRLFCIATFVLCAALFASAQRGGGRAVSGGHSGFAAGGSFGGRMGGGQAFGGMRSGVTSRGFGSRGFTHGSSFHQPSFHQSFHRPGFSGGFHRRDRRFRDFGFRNCFGCRRGFGWPWWYAGYYDPYWWWDSGSSYDEDRARELELANEMNAQSLAEQRMRGDEDQDTYARSDPQPQPSQADAADASTPATMLIFRDRHLQEVQNYAIVGSTVWVFGAQRTQKISVADLDLPATAKANDGRGVEFRVPGESPGQ
jgi:hypothetical protein